MVRGIKKEKEQREAKKLRARGYSIKEIARKLCVSQGSVSPWVRDVDLSEEAKSKIEQKRKVARLKANKTHKKQKLDRLAKSRDLASSIVKKNDLNKISLALIYWCEGAKNDSSITFINSDPDLVTTFMSLMRSEFLVVESKFRVCMHLHSYHKKDKQLKFWSKITNIPKRQFIQPYQKMNTRKQTRDGYQGCVSVRYYDASLAQLLQAIARAYMESKKGL